MSTPDPGPRPDRHRLAGLLTLGIALVLLVSSVTWFAGDRVGVGIGQLVVAVAVAAVGVVLFRRGSRT